jgi:hypothetical protein
MVQVGRDNRGKLTGSSAINDSKHPSDSRDPVPQAAYNFLFRYAIPSPNGAKLGKAWWSSRPEQTVRVAHFHSIHPRMPRMRNPCDRYAVRIYQLVFDNAGACDEGMWRTGDVPPENRDVHKPVPL